MSIEQFKISVDKMAEHYAQDVLSNFADVTIIGGEPTLVPPKFYDECLPYIREKFDSVGKPYLLAIVTNFTSTNGLKRYSHHFDVVTTSYEYDRFDNQLLTNLNTKKSIWWKNVEDWIASGRKLGLSIAITQNTANNIEECLDMLYNKGVRYFQFNYMHPDGELLKGISTKKNYSNFVENRKTLLTTPMSDFKIEFEKTQSAWGGFKLEATTMIRVLNWWLDKMRQGVRDIEIYPITAHAETISGERQNSELLCPSSGALCVRTDGSVTGCTIEAGQTDMISYGNLFTDDLKTIIDSPIRQAHVGTLNTPPSPCFSCDFFQMCKGNCKFRAHAWSELETDECQGLKSYLEHIRLNVSEFYELYKLQKTN